MKEYRKFLMLFLIIGFAGLVFVYAEGATISPVITSFQKIIVAGTVLNPQNSGGTLTLSSTSDFTLIPNSANNTIRVTHNGKSLLAAGDLFFPSPHDVTSSRNYDTIYHNTSPKTLIVNISVEIGQYDPTWYAQAYTVVDSNNPPTANYQNYGFFGAVSTGVNDVMTNIVLIVPPGYYYMLGDRSTGNPSYPHDSNFISITKWNEYYD